MTRRQGFAAFVRRHAAARQLVVQPRMGFPDPRKMRAGLLATKAVPAATIGTITVDSHTRVGETARAAEALRAGVDLNGYPIVSHGVAGNRALLAGVLDDDFPVQVRHGSAVPQQIFAATAAAGIEASEGGPVSYCLPYGRTALADSVRNWSHSCQAFVAAPPAGPPLHLETFGGCMLGQLCPPSLLVALSVLEAMFFVQHGIASVSVSYAQQTNREQDEQAVRALRALAGEFLAQVDWHVVIYAYMGVYPRTPHGGESLLAEAARLAVCTGAERLIVKTTAEAHRIPTIGENVAALNLAAEVAARTPEASAPADDSQTYAEARVLIEAVLDLHADLGQALLIAFRRGYLDVPYCLHPDNQGRTRSYLDANGALRWADIGALPLTTLVAPGRTRDVTSAELLTSLSYMQRHFDALPAPTAQDAIRGHADS
ncbi:methylaspartate mutase [Micromonospora sp. FIMYZ51]|uniref:methylaspartate mutase n=1 Tax=Micromonospora sp. FIMYZ51 TaxID=3051832 RepID=UPI00311FD266